MPLSQTLPGTQNTDLVTFTIKANGEAIGTQYQVASINISKEVNRIPMAKIVIYDGDAAAQDFSISNEETFVPGTEIEITAGYHSEETTVFNGIKNYFAIGGKINFVPGVNCLKSVRPFTLATW